MFMALGLLSLQPSGKEMTLAEVRWTGHSYLCEAQGTGCQISQLNDRDVLLLELILFLAKLDVVVLTLRFPCQVCLDIWLCKSGVLNSICLHSC